MTFFARRCRDRHEAEDLTQEVFVRLAQHAETEVIAPDALVFTIAANLLRDKARSDRVRASYRERKRLEDFVGIDPLDPFRITAGRQHVSQLATAIAALPEKTRRIFTLHRLELVDKQTIADSFGLSVRMVEIHLRKALILLSEQIGGEQ